MQTVGRGLIATGSIGARLAGLDWAAIERSLDDSGWSRTPPVLTPAECGDLAALYDDDRRFRSRVDMARYRFGLGEYKYFADPLPPVVGDLRVEAYPRLQLIANRWESSLGQRTRPFPPDLRSFLAICATRGQRKPTPLLLRYQEGGYNCLHQDLYGEIAFPLQLTCVLSRRQTDFTGGESLLVEQRPRQQSRADAVAMEQGELLIFATRYRPVHGARGYYRANLRHGVSRVLSGLRVSLGVIFHNAE